MRTTLILLGVLGLGVGGIVADVLRRREPPPVPADRCAPDGGLRCNGETLEVCTEGALMAAGTCPGGCKDEAGVARCFDAEHRLMAPHGAACRAGMAFCGMTPGTLLVCKDGRLDKGADCPKGCKDEGERAGLYCLDQGGGLRFAPGFPCPEPRKSFPFACGADGQALLVCQDGLLAPHTVRCSRCAQSKFGDLTCLDADGDRVDPATGKKL